MHNICDHDCEKSNLLFRVAQIISGPQPRIMCFVPRDKISHQNLYSCHEYNLFSVVMQDVGDTIGLDLLEAMFPFPPVFPGSSLSSCRCCFLLCFCLKGVGDIENLGFRKIRSGFVADGFFDIFADLL